MYRVVKNMFIWIIFLGGCFRCSFSWGNVKECLESKRLFEVCIFWFFIVVLEVWLVEFFYIIMIRWVVVSSVYIINFDFKLWFIVGDGVGWKGGNLEFLVSYFLLFWCIYLGKWVWV